MIGIVTDKDLRTKFVAQGKPVAEPVANIMASLVKKISFHKVCFNAMLAMMGKRIRHLALEKTGQDHRRDNHP